MNQSNNGTKLYVWDLPTRVFHWCLVLAVATAWATAENDSQLWFTIHRYAGYIVLALLIFRVIWGIAGTNARAVQRFRATLVRRPGLYEAADDPKTAA